MIKIGNEKGINLNFNKNGRLLHNSDKIKWIQKLGGIKNEGSVRFRLS